MKKTQDTDIPPALHYVRFVGEMHQNELDPESGDEDDDIADRTKPLRVAICMSKQASYRLLQAQYLQCDIAFKRVVGFYEFELSGYDRDAKIGTNSFYQTRSIPMTDEHLLGLVYCRVFVTRQTAAAHQFIFQNIDRIVKEDTGQPLQWRHLHAKSLLDFPGILTLTGDQHRGQAKGDWKCLVLRCKVYDAVHQVLDFISPHWQNSSLDSTISMKHIELYLSLARMIISAASSGFVIPTMWET
jgi:hypothetical protein